MVTVERIFKLPVPDWNRVTPKSLDYKTYGLCYQQYVDNSWYGPYGFNTEKAEKIIECVFPRLFYWDSDEERLVGVNTPRRKGLYFFSEIDVAEALVNDLKKYRLWNKKNEMRLRHGKSSEGVFSVPLLLRLKSSNCYEEQDLEALMLKTRSFFICNFYTPQAEEVLIFFDKCVFEMFEAAARKESVNVVSVDSIDELAAW